MRGQRACVQNPAFRTRKLGFGNRWLRAATPGHGANNVPPEARGRRMKDEEEDKRFIRMLGSSLVAISGRFALRSPKTGELDPEQAFACTAFAMNFGKTPVLLTAGHVIQDELDPI